MSRILDQKVSLLQQQPAFAVLPRSALRALADKMGQKSFSTGEQVILEGGEGDGLYLIQSGRVDVLKQGREEYTTLATLGPGEMFGEMALVYPILKRSATVVARDPLKTFVLSLRDFRWIMDHYPESRSLWQQLADRLIIHNFLKLASPFRQLSPKELQILAARVTRQTVKAGEIIIRQGDKGETCYLVEKGRVSVFSQGQQEKNELAVLGSGALFGEAALLTGAPRNASVQALEETSLLLLPRSAFLEAMYRDRKGGLLLMELLRLRDRPRRKPNILVEGQTASDGTRLTVLKDPEHGTYYQLSEEGWFIWKLLDGERHLKDLTLEYFERFRRFEPHRIAEILAGLAEAGFTRSRAQKAIDFWKKKTMTRSERLVRALLSVLEWRVVAHGVDARLTQWYRHGIRYFFTDSGQCALGVVTVVGFLAFLGQSLRVSEVLSQGLLAQSSFGWLWVPFFLVTMFLGVVIHEAGHAFTVKYFGRQVMGLGFGWYWIGPIFYVDTSDMWLASKWPRIAVSLAGSYANLILAGILALTGLAFMASTLGAACWVAALSLYLIVLLSLNPLMEYDGYYVLIDLLDRPNLRRKSFRWLRENWRQLMKPGVLVSHYWEVLYSLGSILYIGFVGVQGLLLYWLLLRHNR